MEKRKIGFELLVFEDEKELSQNEQKLLREAMEAKENAYAPYSKFKVGAAVLLDNGEVVIGNNQENSSYPSGLCAERVAVFQAGAKYPGVTIKTIAITASSANHEVQEPAAPCGNCRQSIIEYEQKQGSSISLLLRSEKGPIYKCNSVSDILPLAFNSSFLGDS
ncbi:MAG: cytidine deaminase [Bacteroidota bacterium]|uniref:Cytidine deaminase n=1 Tax=Flagellimonas okinawensis TaxID=3031324 RepID=A0ABT5XSY7_9FLAO|nr:cytidine deaminase [[Muricauda] okinawensis]MDF0709003.1 cytidine deaminase [[Muricauda] okinawensis]MEC8831340.1 cytidine deaminase [Bacteroidota bacterium]